MDATLTRPDGLHVYIGDLLATQEVSMLENIVNKPGAVVVVDGHTVRIGEQAT